MITVIIPVYNVEKYVAQCLDSILGQTYTNLEIILVDDGSTDASGRICDEYANLDTRIKVIHKENGGLSSARNAALDIATGEYIAFVDSDDYLALDTLEKCHAKLLKTNADVCMFSHYIVNATSQAANTLPFDKEFYNHEEVKSIIFPKFFGKTKTDSELEGFVCRQIFKREIIGNLRFRSEREYFAEDVVFDIELYKKVSAFCVIDEPLYYYRYVSSSLSNKYRENLFQKLQNLLKFMDKAAKENQVKDARERILHCAYRFALYGCRNLKNGTRLTKQAKIKGIKEITRDEYVSAAVREISYGNFKEKVFAWLLKRKAARLILALI